MHIKWTLLAIATISVAGISASKSVNNSSLTNDCVVTDFNHVEAACAKCSNLVISGITVPAGKTLTINLKEGAHLTIKGEIKFGVKKNWAGALVDIAGSRVTVIGEAGHKLNGEGQEYWDGKGGSGKPVFVTVRTTNKSVLENINILNCPGRCVAVLSSDTTFNKWNIDVSLGDTKGGHNTDGFDISHGKNLVFENCVIKNQDDCVAINSGSDMTFNKFECHGSHGLSIAVGMSSKNGDENSAKNIVFENSKFVNCDAGVHIKTIPTGGNGLVSNIVYRNIELSGMRRYGILMEQDYGDKGHLKANIPIKNLTVSNVKGTMAVKTANNVYIACASGGCLDWHWSDIKITGGVNKCNYEPSGFKC